MSMKAVAVVLLVALALGTVASATTASSLPTEQLAMLQKQLPQRRPKLGARPTANITAAIQEVSPFEGPFVEGDIVVSSADYNKLYVLNGTSLELKGSLASTAGLEDCQRVFGLAFSPDNSFLAVACQNQQQVVLLNTTDTTLVNVTSFTTSAVCPTGNCIMLQVVYKPSGDLLGTGAGIVMDEAKFFWYSAQAAPNGTVSKSWVMTEPQLPVITTSTSLLKDGKTLLYTDVAPAVMRFNLSGNSTATALAAVADGQCMSVVALHDNTLLAGGLVTNATFNGFCAYHLSAKGDTLASWCTPSAYTGNVTGPAEDTISVALDVDRKSFVVSIQDGPGPSDPPGAAVKGAAHNIFRVRLSDFKTLSSGAVPAEFSWSSAVFGAAPASQQECDVGPCCTPSGLFAPAAAPCRASESPCVKAGVCDGKSAACPHDNVEHGTLCSLRPWGLFDPVDESTKDLSEEEARYRGYHKCGMCSFGVCVPGHAGRKGGDYSSGHGRPLRAAAAADSRSEVQGRRHTHLTYCKNKQE